MVSIAEQAKQVPKNATPFGFDATEILYPSVNTCATISLVGARGLAGLHLGLVMGDVITQGVREGEHSQMIDQAYLDMYLNVLRQQAHVKADTVSQAKLLGKTVERRVLEAIYVAGALEIWKGNAAAQWKRLKSSVDKWAGESNIKPRYFQFDDKVAETVDIHVRRAGVSFTKAGTATAVGTLAFIP